MYKRQVQDNSGHGFAGEVNSGQAASDRDVSQSQPTSGLSEAWPRILDRLQQQDLDAWIAVRTATLNEEFSDDSRIVLDHHTVGLANMANSERFADMYRTVTGEVMGQPRSIMAVVGSDGSASPTGKAEASGQDSGTIGDSGSIVPGEDDLSRSRSNTSAILERARAMEKASRAENRSGQAAAQASNATADSSPSTSRGNGKKRPRWEVKNEEIRQRKEYNMANGFEGGVPLPPEPPMEPGEEFVPSEAPNTPPSGVEADGGRDGGVQNSEEDEIMDALSEREQGTGEREERTPLEIAGELIVKHLDGKRMR